MRSATPPDEGVAEVRDRFRFVKLLCRRPRQSRVPRRGRPPLISAEAIRNFVASSTSTKDARRHPGDTDK